MLGIKERCWFFTFSVLGIFLFSTQAAIAEEYEFERIDGDDISTNPVAQEMLKKIELSKKILAELQNGTPIALTEQQKFVEEQRKLAKATLQKDLERMNKEYEDYTPRNAFARYVSDKPDYMQAFYWDQFNYLNDKVSEAQKQRDLIIKNGGSYQQAQQVFIKYATFPKSEVYSVFNELVDKHDLYDHYAGELDPDKWYPTQAIQMYNKWNDKTPQKQYQILNSNQNNFDSTEIQNDIKPKSNLVQNVSIESAFVIPQNEITQTSTLAQTQVIESTQTKEDTFVSLNGKTMQEMNGQILNGAKEFTISAWIKPDYNTGSPTSTILSKPGVFDITLNNFVEPRQIIKFSVFDGIKWNTLESFTKIDENWNHIAVVLKDSNLSLYLNGKLESQYHVGGVISLNSKGMIQTTPLELITSSEPIYIGAQKILKLDGDKVKNYFAGQIDEILIDDKAIVISQIFEEKKI